MAYDLNRALKKSYHLNSPDQDPQVKQSKMQRRWEHVMERKNANSETKQIALKEMLNKKFKKEKAHMNRLQELKDVRQYDEERKAEKLEQAKQRREYEENKENQRKLAMLSLNEKKRE